VIRHPNGFISWKTARFEAAFWRGILEYLPVSPTNATTGADCWTAMSRLVFPSLALAGPGFSPGVRVLNTFAYTCGFSLGRPGRAPVSSALIFPENTRVGPA